MTISRVKPGNWGVNEVLTSAQINGIDANVAKALDKTTAGDTLAGLVQFGGNAQIYANTTGGAGNLNTGAISAAVTGAIQSNASQGIQSNVASGIAPTVASGITAAVAGGIDGNAAAGIRASVAGGISSGVTGGITLAGGANDYPTFPARTRSVHLPLAGNSVFQPLTNASWFFPGDSAQTGTLGCFIYTQLSGRLHQGATLTNVRLYWIVGSSHLPVQPPQIQIVRYLASSLAAGVALNATAGQNLSSAGTAAAYYAGGAIQAFDYACTINNAIDLGTYTYMALISDESGGGAVAGNTYARLRLDMGSITDMRFQ